MKNKLIKFLCSLFPKNKQFTSIPERVLIVSTTGLGDTLWGTPAIKALQVKYLAVLTSPVGALVLKDNPHIDALFILKKSLSLFCRLKKQKFDTIYLFHASQRLVFPLCHLLAPYRFIGTAGLNKGLDSLFTETKPPRHEHEIKRRLSLIGKEEAPTAMEFFASYPEGDPLPPHSYGIHPGAKDKFKQWDKKHYIALGRRLVEEKKATLFISGSQAEYQLLHDIARHIPGAKVLILPLQAFAQKLKQYTCFITNDTGPMHLAFALKVPTVALFAPTDPALCGPLDLPYVRFVKQATTCTPCLKQKCHLPFCLEQISVDQVMRLIF